jgi:hypothetical protein
VLDEQTAGGKFFLHRDLVIGHLSLVTCLDL